MGLFNRLHEFFKKRRNTDSPQRQTAMDALRRLTPSPVAGSRNVHVALSVPSSAFHNSFLEVPTLPRLAEVSPINSRRLNRSQSSVRIIAHHNKPPNDSFTAMSPSKSNATTTPLRKVIIHPKISFSNISLPITAYAHASEEVALGHSRDMLHVSYDISPARLADLRRGASVSPLLQIYNADGTIDPSVFVTPPHKLIRNSASAPEFGRPSLDADKSHPESAISAVLFKSGIGSLDDTSSSSDYSHPIHVETASRIDVTRSHTAQLLGSESNSPRLPSLEPLAQNSLLDGISPRLSLASTLPSPPPSPAASPRKSSGGLGPSRSNFIQLQAHRSQQGHSSRSGRLTAPDFGRPKNLLHRCEALNLPDEEDQVGSMSALRDPIIPSVRSRLEQLSRHLDELENVLDSTKASSSRIEALVHSPSTPSDASFFSLSSDSNEHDQMQYIASNAGSVGTSARDSLMLIRDSYSGQSYDGRYAVPLKGGPDDALMTLELGLQSTPPLRVNPKPKAGASKIPRLSRSPSSLKRSEGRGILFNSMSTFGKHHGKRLTIEEQATPDLSAELTESTRQMMSAARASVGRRRQGSRSTEEFDDELDVEESGSSRDN